MKASAWKGGSYYAGPLTRGGEPVLLVAGEVLRSEDDPAGDPTLWLFRRASNNHWGLSWRRDLEDLSIIHGLRALWQPGDSRNQIAFYGGGVDWDGIAVYRFRGARMEPVRLALVGHSKLFASLRRRGGATELVERAELLTMVRFSMMRLPLSRVWQGHVFAIRRYVYNARTGSYRLLGNWAPDRALERQLPRAFRSTLVRKLVLMLRNGP